MEEEVKKFNLQENEVIIDKRRISLEKSNKMLITIFIFTSLINIILVYSDDSSKGLNVGAALLFLLILCVALASIIIATNNLFELNTIKTGRKYSIILKFFVALLIVVLYRKLLFLFAN